MRQIHHGALDPHFWLDPLRAAKTIPKIVEAFGKLAPAAQKGFETRGGEVKAALEALHKSIETKSKAWTKRSIVTFHGSFGYYADRYDLDIAAVVEPFPGREPTPRYVEDVLAAIRASSAAALFSEPQLDARPARIISEHAGVPLHEIDPVGGGRGVDTYERLLEHDTDVFERALR